MQPYALYCARHFGETLDAGRSLSGFLPPTRRDHAGECGLLHAAEVQRAQRAYSRGHPRDALPHRLARARGTPHGEAGASLRHLRQLLACHVWGYLAAVLRLGTG